MSLREAVFVGGDLSLPQRARRFCDRVLAERLPASTGNTPFRNAVSLVVSELATNAVATGSREIVVGLGVEDDHVLVAVTDTGEGVPQRKEVSPYAPDGRGLMIVGKVSRRWGVTPRVSGKQVWAEIDLPPDLADRGATAGCGAR